ncbi:MAG: serine/threonine protein kinase [Planctomycetes bacterium]|nr:serine/threonine protein kinase [Planctomycetota bacterium]MCB9886495.1 serine/threonine protein kinase [Planctomycetota bacterium]
MTDDNEPRQRFAADLRAGRTIVLAAADLADPALRERLPQLLAELQLENPDAPQLRVRGYTVLGEVARGGMSTVYLARQDLLGRHVALKVVPSALEGTARSRERTLREARAMASLTHPNIVAVYEVVDTGEVLALAMEWIDGLTMAQLLQALPPRETPQDVARLGELLGAPLGERDQESTATRWFVRVIRDVALAAQHVHEAGMLHLDIKPSNILVRRDGTPLLADFGVVREIDLLLTGTRSFAGTPIYAAPEQFQARGVSLTRATDVYSLGMTLYETLARSRPIDEGSLSRILRDLENGRVPRLSSRCEVDADLENVVHRAIDPDPRRRYTSAAAFAADLTAFLEHRQVSAKPWTRVERVRRWARAEPWKAVAVAVIAATVPVAAGLGIKLLVELPRYSAARAEEARQQAMPIVHEAIRDILVRGGRTQAALPQLERAKRLAPDDPIVLGTWAIFGAAVDFAAAARILGDNPVTAEHRSLQLLRERAVARRLTFTDAETRQLLDSPDPVDVALVTMDRLAWLQSGADKALADELLTWVERARLNARDNDPLLIGVTACLAARNGNREEVANCVAAIERLWPDDVSVRLWIPLAQEMLDDKPNLEQTRRLAALFPDSLEAKRRLIQALGPDDADEIDRVIDTMPPQWRRRAAMKEAKDQGDDEKLRALCEELSKDPEELPGSKAALLAMFAPDLSKPFVREVLSNDAPDGGVLTSLAGLLSDPEDRRLLVAGFERTMAAQPPRNIKIVWARGFFGALGQLQDAAPYISAFDGLDGLSPDVLRFCIEVIREAGKWDELERFSKALYDLADGDDNRSRAAFHLGIAAARRGQDEEATRWLDQHRKLAGGRVYSECFQEQARIMASPNTPAGQRDPERALHLCDKLDEGLERRGIPRSPWFGAIRAEVEFANGHVAEALRTALQALEAQRAGPAAWKAAKMMGTWSAPADLEAQLVTAIERYRAAPK